VPSTTPIAKNPSSLFCDSFVSPRTGTRRAIGYASGDAELIELVHLVANEATKTGQHPVMPAARWVAAGFSAEAVARWIRQGVHSPPKQHSSTHAHLPRKNSYGR
jgi:hypothetical protein